MRLDPPEGGDTLEGGRIGWHTRFCVSSNHGQQGTEEASRHEAGHDVAAMHAPAHEPAP